MKIAYLGKIFAESIEPSLYVGKIMTYQAGISNQANGLNDGIPVIDRYEPIKWSDSATIVTVIAINSPHGAATYFQSKGHSTIWIRLDDKISISEG